MVLKPQQTQPWLQIGLEMILFCTLVAMDIFLRAEYSRYLTKYHRVDYFHRYNK